MSCESAKRAKISMDCVLCGANDEITNLHKLKGEQSWETLYNAAKIRAFKPILELGKDFKEWEIFYHKECRSNFTNKRSLEIYKKQNNNPDSVVEENASSSSQNQIYLRGPLHSKSLCNRIYEKECIFCKKDKYIRKTKNREKLTKLIDLRADKLIRQVAIKRQDGEMIATSSRDLVAAEAHYHRSCYKAYVKDISKQEKTSNPYLENEKVAFVKLYEFIRRNLFENPRIIGLTDLFKKFTEFMSSLGESKLSASSKVKLRTNLENNFKNSLHFLSVNNRVYVYPDNFSFYMLAENYIRLKEDINKRERENQSETEKTIITCSTYLRKEIQKIDLENQKWPPNPVDLHADYISIPRPLEIFLENLLGNGKNCSDRLSRSIWSISQDIIYFILKGKVTTPKHVLLPWAVKTLTGNVELIKALNKLGHGCSYTKLEEVETSLCQEKLGNAADGDIALPVQLRNGVPTIAAFDNIDRREEVLSGAGTSHRVNGIAVQQKSSICLPQQESLLDANGKKCKSRSLKPDSLQLPAFIEQPRSNPKALITNENRLSDNGFITSKKTNFVWTKSRLLQTNHQTVSSWTGFNIKLRNNVEVTPNTIEYLPTINHPATNMSTVQEILRQSLLIKEELGLQVIAVVMDQAIYSKALEIYWLDPDKYSGIFLMMGNFHIICNLLSIIGKIFGDAGLRDLAVESNVVAEGSVAQMLEGKHYNRGVRFHKLMYETFMRLIWKTFPEWIEENFPQLLPDLEKMDDIFQRFTKNNINNSSFNTLITDPTFEKILKYFDKYLNFLRRDNGPLSAFWMQYVDVVEVLLGLIRGDREGNWDLHLYCIRRMIPLCFALDKINYSRYLSFYLAQALQLQDINKDLYSYFLQGGFTAQLKDSNPFSKIAIDQTLEETVNKDTQTAGGTKGFSLKPGAVHRYYVSAEFRTSALRQLRKSIEYKESKFSHPDLQPRRILRDEKDVSSLNDLLENSWSNPFSNTSSELVHLATGIRAGDNVTKDLLSIVERGEKEYKLFRENRLEKGQDFYKPLKKVGLKTFSSTQKKFKKCNKTNIMLQTDRKLFATMILIAENRQLNMRKVLSHPLGPIPWSLANPDGSLRKTNKAILGTCLESRISSEANWPKSSACIIDGMALIHKTNAFKLKPTFQELSQMIFKEVLRIGSQSQRIDVVFDVYKDESIKNAERERRRSSGEVSFDKIEDGHRIRNWKLLLSDNDCKNKITTYMADNWKKEKNKLPEGKVLYVTYGKKCWKITKNSSEEENELFSSQEEADTRILLHANHASLKYSNVVSVADDTDILILFVSLSKYIKSPCFIRRGFDRNKIRIVNTKTIAETLGDKMQDALIGFHSFTGCDTVSSFANRGKQKGFELLESNKKFQKAFADLGSAWQLSEETFQILEKFTCQVYSKNTKIEKINQLRYSMFQSKNGGSDSGQLPPCEDCFRQHTLRSNYQAAIWRRSLQNEPDIPKPFDGHGWILNEENKLEICWMTGAPAPESVLDLLSCNCAKSCKLPSCSCKKNNLRCTPACKKQDCENMKLDDDDEEEEEEEETYYMLAEDIGNSSGSDSDDDDDDDEEEEEKEDDDDDEEETYYMLADDVRISDGGDSGDEVEEEDEVRYCLADDIPNSSDEGDSDS